MRSWGIALNRFCLASWVGAAIFFVAVAIKPIRSPELESPQRALLASLLFPGYYAFGFTLLGLAWVCLGCSRPRYWGWQLALVTIALLLAGIDWFVIYSPLADMTRRQWMEQAAPSSSFRNYHIASMVINATGLFFSLTAAILACLPATDLQPKPEGFGQPH